MGVRLYLRRVLRVAVGTVRGFTARLMSCFLLGHHSLILWQDFFKTASLTLGSTRVSPNTTFTYVVATTDRLT